MSLFFFFKQKTAYEMLRSLVGSEMCIRDRFMEKLDIPVIGVVENMSGMVCPHCQTEIDVFGNCLLYTSDAADDLLCVDLGGRRIIKKKKKKEHLITNH